MLGGKTRKKGTSILQRWASPASVLMYWNMFFCKIFSLPFLTIFVSCHSLLNTVFRSLTTKTAGRTPAILLIPSMGGVKCQTIAWKLALSTSGGQTKLRQRSSCHCKWQHSCWMGSFSRRLSSMLSKEGNTSLSVWWNMYEFSQFLFLNYFCSFMFHSITFSNIIFSSQSYLFSSMQLPVFFTFPFIFLHRSFSQSLKKLQKDKRMGITGIACVSTLRLRGSRL